MDDNAWNAFLDDVRRRVGRSAVTHAEAAPSPSPAATSNGEGRIPFVAVLPLTHRAGDKEMEVLAEDLTEEITRALARSHYFKVIAAGAAWRDRVVDHQAVGHQLRARYVIEGKLQRLGRGCATHRAADRHGHRGHGLVPAIRTQLCRHGRARPRNSQSLSPPSSARTSCRPRRAGPCRSKGACRHGNMCCARSAHGAHEYGGAVERRRGSAKRHRG